MSNMKNFAAELTELGIDPQQWAAARAGETNEWADFRLARDLEELVADATFRGVIKVKPGDSLLDVWSVLWVAMSRWALKEEEASDVAPLFAA